MSKSGWRTVVINNSEKIGYSYDQLVIKNDIEHNVPIEQIKTVMIDTTQTNISTKLIAELVSNNVKVIFCDEKHNPIGEITPYNSNIYAPGRLYEQTLWTQSDKDIMWQKIVKLKIIMQQKLLATLKKSGTELLQQYLEEVEIGDVSNREGQAARVYFNSLFGMSFRRRTENNINAALNYGYTVLLSTVNRVVTLHGYHLGLGIGLHGRLLRPTASIICVNSSNYYRSAWQTSKTKPSRNQSVSLRTTIGLHGRLLRPQLFQLHLQLWNYYRSAWQTSKTLFLFLFQERI